MAYLFYTKKHNKHDFDSVMHIFFCRSELRVCHSELCRLLWGHQPICSISRRSLLHSAALSFSAMLTMTILKHTASAFYFFKVYSGSMQSGNSYSTRITSPTTFPGSCGYLVRRQMRGKRRLLLQFERTTY